MQASEEKIKEDITVLPISFGNPSNEIIHGQLHLSQNKEHANKTVAMIGIPTEIDLKEIFAFLQKSNSSLKMSHMKILSQESSQNNAVADPSESYYCALCSFSTTTHSDIFIKHLNGQYFNAELAPNKCCLYYLVNSIIIIHKAEDKYKEMHFPPTRITAAHLIKQNSNPLSANNHDEEDANCAFCFDSVQPPFTASSSPKTKKKNIHCGHNPFKLLPSTSGSYLENDEYETPSLSSSPPPKMLAMASIAADDKWYDNDATVCFVLCGHFFHVMCLMRCEQNSCPICRHYLFPESSSICNSCKLCTKDLWVCLTCGHLGCGRFSNQCALTHYKNSSHVWAKCLTTSHVWDYADDDYVYRILMAVDGKLVSLQTANDGIDGSSKHLPQELDVMSSVKQEEFIYEYNFEAQHRLKRLQSFHKSKEHRKVKHGQRELNKLDMERKRIAQQIEAKKRSNMKLLSKYTERYLAEKEKEKKEEFVDDLEYLRQQLEQERHRNEALKRMIHRGFVEQKTGKEKLKEYGNSLEKALGVTESALNGEINALKNELRDYRAHIDTSRKMEKAASRQELDGASIEVKPGKSKNNQKRQLKNRAHSNKKTKKSRKSRK